MPDKFVFADEAGDFTFERKEGASRYFVLCTVVMDDCEVAARLLALRRALVWEGADLRDYFHAAPETQFVRDRVFAVLNESEFSIQATIMEKSKAQPQVCADKAKFYQYGWFYHFKFGVRSKIGLDDRALITTASLGTKRERRSFETPVHEVMRQTLKSERWATDFWPSASDPCLQVADYCAWAIQRKWELGDTRSYDLIKDRISYEYDLWKRGTTHYY